MRGFMPLHRGFSDYVTVQELEQKCEEEREGGALLGKSDRLNGTCRDPDVVTSRILDQAARPQRPFVTHSYL